MTDLSLEYLRSRCILNIKVSVLALVGTDTLRQEIDALSRRLRAIEFEFRVKSWVLPDYVLWQKTGEYASSVQEPGSVR